MSRLEKQMELASITLQPTTANDESFLLQLYATTRRDELTAWGWDPAQQEQFIELQYRAQTFSYRAQYPHAEFMLILRDSKPIGRMIVQRSEAEIHLIDISILPEHQGQGIGTLLIQNLQKNSIQTGKPILLHVLQTNRAIRLYQRLEFVILEEIPLYYIMRWIGNRKNQPISGNDI